MSNYTFNQKYHLDTVKQGKEMVNDDGSVTTANTIGINYKGKEYNLPSYDREYVDKNGKRGRNRSPQETIKFWKKELDSGMIKGHGSIDEAEKAAKSEHKMMDDYARKHGAFYE